MCARWVGSESLTYPVCPISSRRTSLAPVARAWSLARSAQRAVWLKPRSGTTVGFSSARSRSAVRNGLLVPDGFPALGFHGAVGSVEDDVDDVAVLERLARPLAAGDALDEVAHFSGVAVGPRLVDRREEPTGLRLGPLDDATCPPPGED